MELRGIFSGVTWILSPNLKFTCGEIYESPPRARIRASSPMKTAHSQDVTQHRMQSEGLRSFGTRQQTRDGACSPVRVNSLEPCSVNVPCWSKILSEFHTGLIAIVLGPREFSLPGRVRYLAILSASECASKMRGFCGSACRLRSFGLTTNTAPSLSACEARRQAKYRAIAAFLVQSNRRVGSPKCRAICTPFQFFVRRRGLWQLDLRVPLECGQ